MSTASQSADVVSAPYVPFPTFKSFLGKLAKNGGVPSNINKSVMNGIAGGTQSHLTIALKFLNLIDESGTPSPELEQLVSAHGTSDWAQVLKPIIVESYNPIIGDLDLLKASADELDNCFIGLTAATLDKTVRFYVAALSDSQIGFSAFIKDRKPKATRTKRSNGGTTKSKKANKEEPKRCLLYTSPSPRD